MNDKLVVGSVVFNPAPNAAAPFTTMNTQILMMSCGGQSPQMMQDRITTLERELAEAKVVEAKNAKAWGRAAMLSDVKPVVLDVGRIHELISLYRDAPIAPIAKFRARKDIVNYFIAHDAALQAEIDSLRKDVTQLMLSTN